MIEHDSIWIDMDGTLMDWSKGNVRKALIDIADPDYYRTLEPTGDKIHSYLLKLKSKGKHLILISGIPDCHYCQYVPIYKYRHYYYDVCNAKDYTIEKYFHKVFDEVIYTVQSEPKSRYVKNHYLRGKNPVFIDDYSGYIDDWKKNINQNAFKVDETHSCEYYLEQLVKEVI